MKKEKKNKCQKCGEENAIPCEFHIYELRSGWKKPKAVFDKAPILCSKHMKQHIKEHNFREGDIWL